MSFHYSKNKPVTGDELLTTLPSERQNVLKMSAILMLGSMLTTSAISADETLLEAVKSTTDCRTITDPQQRLDCFDKSVKQLADLVLQEGTSQEMVNAPRQSDKQLAEQVTQTDAPVATSAQADERAEPVVAKTNTRSTSSDDSEVKATEPSEISTDDGLPLWAAAPQFTREEKAQETRDSFDATIVRITRNSLGKHRFYTEDGAVWEQTQKVKVVPPRSLPTVAEFRQRATGSPTIKFADVSNRSYRVRRVK